MDVPDRLTFDLNSDAWTVATMGAMLDVAAPIVALAPSFRCGSAAATQEFLCGWL